MDFDAQHAKLTLMLVRALSIKLGQPYQIHCWFGIVADYNKNISPFLYTETAEFIFEEI